MKTEGNIWVTMGSDLKYYPSCSEHGDLSPAFELEDDVDAHTIARLHNLNMHRDCRLPIYSANGERYYAR